LFIRRALDNFEFELRVWTQEVDAWLEVKSDLITEINETLRQSEMAAQAQAAPAEPNLSTTDKLAGPAGPVAPETPATPAAPVTPAASATPSAQGTSGQGTSGQGTSGQGTSGQGASEHGIPEQAKLQAQRDRDLTR
jgi:hypothetical protein